MLAALEQEATNAGATAASVSQGWLFPDAGAVAAVVATALAAASGDDHLLSAEQTIALDAQLELTNGGWWTVRRDGIGPPPISSDWDWELRVAAWGCAEYGTL